MQPFITFRDLDKNGELKYYIMQRDEPHFVGIISAERYLDALVESAVPGYNLYIVFNGVLKGNYIPLRKDIKSEAQSVFDNMASWYWTERIQIDPKRYKKLKISNNV
jgi:hypothetical protein